MFEGDDAIVAMQYWERVIAHAHAQQMKAMLELGELRRNCDGGYDDYLGDEIALALNISGVAANHRFDLAWHLREKLPETFTALERGEIDLIRAQAISHATRTLTSKQAARVEERVLDRAKDQNAPQLRRALKRAVITVDPQGAQARHRERRQDRRVVVVPDEDGMSALHAYLPAAAANAIYLTVDKAARDARTPDDDRTADQRRADAFVDLVLGKVAAPSVQVKVVVPAGTLLGVDDQPGELAGYGPITADMARQIAADATWKRLLTDPQSGTLLDCGRTTYKPPAALADFVRARDKFCQFPGCLRSAQRCELDHRTEYPIGPTSASNLDALCTHHHQLKHRGNWTAKRLANGSYRWISPGGHAYVHQAEPVVEFVATPVAESVAVPTVNADPPPF